MPDVIKGIEIIDDASALQEFDKHIRKNGLSLYRIGDDKTVYAIGDTEEERDIFNDAIEENAFALNLDFARAKLFYVDKASGKIRESKKAMEQFIQDSEIDDFSEGVPVSLLPELVDFIGENEAVIAGDIAAVFQEKESESESEAKAEPIDQTQEEKENAVEDDFEDDVADDFVDDVEEANQTNDNQESAQSLSEEREPEEESPEIEPEIEEEKENVAPNIETQEEQGQDNENQSLDQQKEDPLMEKAIELFASHHPVSLPKFDELTHKGLQERILDSQFTVSKARDKGINEIYHRLKSEVDQSAETIKSNVIEEARKKHEEVLNKIDRNYKYDVDKLLNNHNAEYEKDREKYVQSKIPALRKEYDAQYYPDYENAVTAEIERLQQESSEAKNKEIESFQTYVNHVLDDSKEKVMNAVRVEDIIEEYNKTAAEQKDILLQEAKIKKDEIGSAMSDMVKERDRLKEEINGVQSQLEEQKQSEQERIDSGVTASLQQKEQDLRKENKKELDKAYEKEQQLLKQVENLEEKLKQEKQDKERQKEEYIEPSKEGESDNENTNGAGYPAFMDPNAPPSKFNKIKFIVGCGIAAISFILLAIVITSLGAIKDQMAIGNSLDRSSYLADLEADERYDKAADEMKKFGYDSTSIADMYMEHDRYISALETDKGVLPDVYSYADSKESEDEQREILEKVKSDGGLEGEYLNGVDVRLAILDEDTESVHTIPLDEKVDESSAQEATQYLIDKEEYDHAEELLKNYPNDELSKSLEEAKFAAIEDEAEELEKDIKSLEEDIDDKEKKGDELEKKLDTEKKKKKKKKRKKEIKKNDEKKDSLTDELEDKEEDLEELTKEI